MEYGGMQRMLKKLRIKKLLVLTFFIAGLSLTTGCVANVQTTSEPVVIAPDVNILRVGVTPNAPPLIFKQGNAIVGLEADFAREFAKYLGKSPRFVELEWEDQIPALLENRIESRISTHIPLRRSPVDVSPRHPGLSYTPWRRGGYPAPAQSSASAEETSVTPWTRQH